MPDVEFLKFAAPLGVGGVLALVMFLVYRKDMRYMAELHLAQLEAWKGQTEILVAVVKDNTTALSALVTELRREHA